jgi:hypothetical protein
MAFSLGDGVIPSTSSGQALSGAVFQAERRACPELAEGISRYDTVCHGRSLGPLVKTRALRMTPREIQNSKLTSTIRGVPSEVVLNEEDCMKSPCAVNLHNAVTVSQQRLGKRVAQLSSARMNEVCAALRFSLGCDAN